MDILSDDIILYDSYCKLAQKKCSKIKTVDTSGDKSVVSSMTSKSSLLITKLTSTQSLADVQKPIMNAKSMFTQYSSIKGRNPSYISDSLDRNMDKLIHEVCRWESVMIANLRLQEPGGERIDIQSIFDTSKYLNRLGSKFARTIVSEALIDDSSEYMLDLYITDTGKKFHRADCPYCKDREMIPATRDQIKVLGLKPCKCLGMDESKDDRGVITVFIDESIRPIKWGENGKPGVSGSYSYIICRGNVLKETQITDEMLIARGVEHTAEHEHVDRITKSAIEKVLIILAYEYDFVGRVHIFTDNKSVAKDWHGAGINGKLAELFADVLVSYVPRKENRRADMLCGSRTILNVPTLTYKEIAKKCARADELEEKVKELEAQLEAREKAKTVPFTGLLSNIRNRFSSVFGTTAV